MGVPHQLTAFEILFGFRGRIGRISYFLYNLLAGAVVVVVTLLVFVQDTEGFLARSGLPGLFLPWLLGLWPLSALTWKRLQDLDFPGLHTLWLWALWLYPHHWLPAWLAWPSAVAGLIAALWLLLAPGTSLPNRYGPKTGTSRELAPAASAG